ncbi:hypothetical protein NLJ89_g12402 [Agrocybe chaxingu]|uniref:Uncharacterized protein n=1 Tax=Agrocybe chaxingu TaxID=84603 RepID=A0A9W8MP42_9AGAR|nr:hypothetical protein NLJ89_g12402 [Agrocybe chaxingu]
MLDVTQKFSPCNSGSAISYADAAHRLYMAQVAKIHEQAEAVEAYAALRRGVETIIIEDIYEALSRIEDNEGGV